MPVKIVLKSGKDEAVRRFHPWVFSGAIKKIYGEAEDCDLVEVFSNHDEYLGTGHYQNGSIAVRILSFEHVKDIKEILKSRISSAYNYRAEIGLADNPEINVYRLVFAEGDGLPGLIIDWYNGTAVLQSHSIGMYHARRDITEALKELLGERLLAVYDKSEETLPKHSDIGAKNEYLFGEKGEGLVNENGCRFYVDWESGQKTGFYVDQRENRKMLKEFVKGKKVLNTFSYTGGFSISAIKAGAGIVHSVDSSAKAIDLLNRNLQLNGLDPAQHPSFCEDTMHYLEHCNEQYDVIILDPPAYAKHHDVRHNAVQGYKRLNVEAIKKIKSGGFLFTFSCSQVVDRNLFNSTVISAAIVTGRRVRIVHQLSQPPDHPVNAFHPEGQYLKGLVLYIE
jgi:23S rRNA (cytosine1962-C5)-methyltransferase